MGRVRTESKRTEILEAASRIFSDRQFHEVLIDDVASAAHVGKGTIYRYFETKEDLFFATILHGFDGLYEALLASLPREASPTRRLERIAREMLEFFASRGYFFRLVHHDERRFAAREEELQKRRDNVGRLIQECLLDGIERREFRGIDVRIAAELFRGMIRAANGFRRQEDDVDELVSAILEVFVQGIAKERA
jgi:AcrR family transcriptional regulator